MKFNLPPVHALEFDGAHSDFQPLSDMLESSKETKADASVGS
jgi:hypothetical protein